MEGIKNLLGKLDAEDIEKLKILMSLNSESKEIVTLRVFADEYKNLIKKNRSAAYFRSVVKSLDYLQEYFKAQKVIHSITLKDVEAFLIYLQQNVRPVSPSPGRGGQGYVVYYRNLKAAFNKAKEWGYVRENFFTKVKPPKRQKTAPAFINNVQLSAISSQIKSEVVRDVVVTAYYTGLRLNEIVNLRWKNVNLNNRVITVGDELFVTKARKQRFIPICEEVLSTILTQKEKKPALPIGDSFVFSKSNGEKFTGDYFTKRFKKACRAAGIDEAIHFHSLRHSFASNLVLKGVSIYKVKELLGHSSITTTEIYSHLNIDVLREAVSVLESPHPGLLSHSDKPKGEGGKSKQKGTSYLRLVVNNKTGG